MKQNPLAYAALANSIRNCALMVFLGWNLISKVSTFVAMQPLPILFQQLGLQFAKVLCFSKKSRYSGSTLNRSFSASGQVSTLRSAFSSHLILIGLQMQNTWRWRNWLVWLVAASEKKNTRSVKKTKPCNQEKFFLSLKKIVKTYWKSATNGKLQTISSIFFIFVVSFLAHRSGRYFLLCVCFSVHWYHGCQF